MLAGARYLMRAAVEYSNRQQ